MLLKTLPYHGYVPNGVAQIPPAVRTFVAGQLGLLWDQSEQYAWDGRTRDQHLFLIRQHTGWHPATAQDKENLEQWLRECAAYEAHTAELLFNTACEWLRQGCVELPAEGELHRLVNAALSGFCQDLHRTIAEALPAEVCLRMDELLKVPESTLVSLFERLKADAGKPGVDNFQSELEQLKLVRSIGMSAEPFAAVPWKVLQLLKRRAMNETASEMREHPEGICYALMSCFLHVRAMEITDDATRMALELIHRLDTRSEKQIRRELLDDLERVEGKMQILSRVAEAVVEKPDGIVREVIFPQVKEETFRNLVTEFRASGPQLRLLRQQTMHRKFARHYRARIPAQVRCQAVSRGACATSAQVPTGAASRQDPAGGIRLLRSRQSPAARSREARDLRLPRLYAHLRQDPKRTVYCAQADDSSAAAGQAGRGENRTQAAPA